MSQIQQELSEATGIKLKRGQDRQDFIVALMVGVADLKDPEWDALSKPAQAWYNSAADAKNAKKDVMPDFPDYEEAAKEETTTRRRRSADEEDEAPAGKIEVGAEVEVVTARGKEVNGKIIEIGDDFIVVDNGKEEVEVNTKTAKSIKVAGGGSDEPDVPELGVGDTATATNKRGKVVTGKITEMTDELVVIDDGKDEHEFAKDRLESLVPAGKPAEATSTRRRASDDAAPSKGKEKEVEPPADRKRASNGDVSIGTRIKELIAENLDATEADIAKLLKKEGLEFKDNTLKLNFSDAHKFITILKAKKLLK